jgi:hypothetical protein
MRVPILALLLLLAASAPPSAHAAAPGDLLDVATLTQMEARADKASPREQCFLYTELIQSYTDIAGKQMAAGEMAEAGATLKRVQAFADHIHSSLARDTKRVKEAEMMMHTATHRLGQYVHFLSTEDKVVAETTLKQLESVNSELLAQVFAH